MKSQMPTDIYQICQEGSVFYAEMSRQQHTPVLPEDCDVTALEWLQLQDFMDRPKMTEQEMYTKMGLKQIECYEHEGTTDGNIPTISLRHTSFEYIPKKVY